MVSVVVVLVLVWREGGVFLGEVKARPIDILRGYRLSMQKHTTSNPSPNPTPLDMPAMPANSLYFVLISYEYIYIYTQ